MKVQENVITTRGMVNEKEEKLARIKEWRRKKQEKNRLRNLKYNEKNRKKRAEFPREKW